MIYTLNNFTTGDGYTAASTLVCPQSRRLTIFARNAAVYYQTGVGYPAITWDSERFLPAGTLGPKGQRFDAIRVRSGAAGKPAQVTIDADDQEGAEGGFTPDVGQRVAPDGSITYDFDGRIFAHGIDLVADGQPVRWLRQSDGALMADIVVATDQANHSRVLLTTRGSGVAQGTQWAKSQLSTIDDGTGAFIDLKTELTATSPRVAIRTPSKTRVIYQDNGVSHFAQVRGGDIGAGNPRLIELEWTGFDLRFYVDNSHVRTL